MSLRFSAARLGYARLFCVAILAVFNTSQGASAQDAKPVEEVIVHPALFLVGDSDYAYRHGRWQHGAVGLGLGADSDVRCDED